MVRAYILIEMVAGRSRELVDALEGRPQVRDVARVTGPYDIIIVLEAEDVDSISETVADQIHSRAGVLRTTTCVSLG